MNVLEVVLMVGFGVPIVVLCFTFVICASYIEMKESGRFSGEGHSERRREA